MSDSEITPATPETRTQSAAARHANADWAQTAVVNTQAQMPAEDSRCRQNVGNVREEARRVLRAQAKKTGAYEVNPEVMPLQ